MLAAKLGKVFSLWTRFHGLEIYIRLPVRKNKHDVVVELFLGMTPGYVDSDWATCPKTRRSMTGVCIRLAGGTIAWKTKLQPTFAQSSTEAEFMWASDFGRIMLLPAK